MTNKTENAFNPLVSIVIPVYNGENFLREAIDSALAQTYKNIEILVVNDGSTDKTEEICKSYGDKIRYFRKENGGVSTALNAGIREMRGEYFSWLSHDDLYLPKKVKHQIDVLRKLDDKETVVFSETQAISEDGRNLDKRFRFGQVGKIKGLDIMLKWVMSGCALLVPRNFFEKYGVFNEKLLVTQDYELWFRFFRDEKILISTGMTDICSRVHQKQTGMKLRKEVLEENDSLWLLILSSLTDDYMRSFSGSLIAFYEYAKKTFGFSEYKKVSAWCNEKIKSVFLAESAFDHHVEKDGIAPIVDYLFRNDRMLDGEIAKNIFRAKSLQTKKHEARTIGIFYHRIFEGGVERVISLHIPMFLKMGYKVVLFTEKFEPRKEFKLPSTVERVMLPESFANGRAEIFLSELLAHHVDVFIHHAHLSDTLLLDLLLIKSLGIKTTVIRHGLSLVYFVFNNFNLVNNAKIYLLADELITLSTCDENFYRNFGINAKYIPNPIEKKSMMPNSHVKNEFPCVIWVGRLDWPKGYRDALLIFKAVAEKNKNARCYFIGGEYTHGAEQEINSIIVASKLQNNVFLIDYTLNIDEWYKKADVFLFTSLVESFAMVLLEAKSYGLPIVTYDLPYLELLKDGKGFVSVKQHDVAGAANAILNILENGSLAKKLSNDGISSYNEFCKFDYEKAWNTILEEPAAERKKLTDAENEQFMFWETLNFLASEGVNTLQGNRTYLHEKPSETHLLQAVLASRTYRVGCIVTKPFKILRKIVRRIERKKVGKVLMLPFRLLWKIFYGFAKNCYKAARKCWRIAKKVVRRK